MNRTEFIRAHPLERTMQEHGVKLTGGGNHRMAVCPFHEDKNPSMSVDLEKEVWFCHGCGAKGSVIDFLALKQGKTIAAVMGGNGDGKPWKPAPKRAPEPPPDDDEPPPADAPAAKPVISKTYSYTDETGTEVFQVVRMVPKTFRQRHQGPGGAWIWSMDGVQRVLYRLHEVVKKECVWVCEGEKDADNLADLGFCATTNVGGAKKWLDSYSDDLAGKDVVICGDTDEPGQDHIKVVFESIRNKARTVRLVNLPKEYKDASEFIEAMKDRDKARSALTDMALAAHPHIRGVSVPVYHVSDLEAVYVRHVENLGKTSLDLGKWLPTLGRQLRHLVPGEFMLILGGTGIGKTSLLTNIGLVAQPMPTLFFEFELPAEKIYERTVATRYGFGCKVIEDAYKTGEVLGAESLIKAMPSLYICHEASLDPEKLEAVITRSELKIGRRPALVLLDYMGLMGSKGTSRYDRMSTIAEAVKQIAKRTQTIIVAASQIARKRDDESSEVTLCEGKDSGSLENSAGVVLGAWRDASDNTLIHLKILKNSNGFTGTVIPCNYDLTTLKITERAMPSQAEKTPPAKEQKPPPYPDA